MQVALIKLHHYPNLHFYAYQEDLLLGNVWTGAHRPNKGILSRTGQLPELMYGTGPFSQFGLGFLEIEGRNVCHWNTTESSVPHLLNVEAGFIFPLARERSKLPFHGSCTVSIG